MSSRWAGRIPRKLKVSMRRYNATAALPVSVTVAEPPTAPPRVVTTTGCLKQRFIVWTRVHARMYDISIAADAWRKLPVRAMCSSSSTLPGPSAMSRPDTMRMRGTTRIVAMAQ